jgi:chemotaxis protein MotB
MNITEITAAEKPAPQKGSEPIQTPAPKIISPERRVKPPAFIPDNTSQHVAFLLDDTFYRSRIPKSNHWSIVWSDLMMTMFILFLTMFAHQATQTESEDFLANKTPEVVGGTTTDAIDLPGSDNDTSLPFTPINQGAPLVTAGTIKRVESVTGDAMTPKEEKRISRSDVFDQPPKTESQGSVNPPTDNTVLPSKPVSNNTPPLSPEVSKEKSVPLDAMYDLSQQVLTENNLKKFASIDLIPDTTMRIILTGDLLFNPGKADLSQTARQSLQKVATAIKNSPYMINVVGHTDNVPMSSEQYNTNWELSVARASRVARFLIEENNMNPNQFVVSGYSSFRPVKPNTNVENRAINRRVEIIISKKLPPAEPATSENLQSP